MNTDLLRETFRDLEETSPTLDPERVIAGARRRGVRRRAVATGAAALGTAAVVAAGSALVRPITDPVGPSSAPSPSKPSIPSTPYVTPPPLVATPPPPAASLPVPAPPPVLADGVWVPFPAGVRFRTRGPTWEVDQRGVTMHFPMDGETLGRGWEVGLAAGRPADRVASTSVLRGDIRRVVYTAATAAGTVRAEARVARLAALPGWVMAHASYRLVGTPDRYGILYAEGTLDAYDGSGRRVLHCRSSAYGATCAAV